MENRIVNCTAYMLRSLPARFAAKRWGRLASEAELFSAPAAADDITVSCYRGDVPPHVEADMERLYQNIFSSVRQFEIYECIGSDTHTYIAQKNGIPVAVLLFRQKGSRIHVLNESIKLDDEQLHRFSQYVFESMPAVSVILFHAIRTDVKKLAFPFQRFNVSEDIVLSLPETLDEYSSRLGKSTRKNIKHHLSRTKRTFPSFSFEVYEGENIREQDIRDIIEMNRARLAAKKKESAISEKETGCIIERAKKYGFVTVIRIDGRVCAGAICSRMGRHYFSHVNSHDPAFDNYRLGTICCYLTVCECIERGGEEFHFLWGEYEYKYMLLGQKRDLDDLIVYRSSMHYLLNSSLVLKTEYQAWRRICLNRLRSWTGRQSGHHVAEGAPAQARGADA